MQLKGSAPAELRYTGLKYLSQPPSPGNYDILYTGPIACAQNQSATLEKGACQAGGIWNCHLLLSRWRLRIQASNSLKMVSSIFWGE